MPFQKFDVKMPSLDVSRIKGDYVEQYGDTFTSYFVKDVDYVLSEFSKILDFTILSDFYFYVEVTKEGAGPHIDESKTSLNYYFEGCEAETLFWTTKNDDSGFLCQNQINKQSQVKTYFEHELISIGSFCAEANSLYLLDISKIHSVKKRSVHNVRRILRFLWDKNHFDEISSSIKIKK
jgi:hypothetical protein